MEVFMQAVPYDSYSSDGNNSVGGFLGYRVRNLEIGGGHTLIQENYNAEAGFVPSRGVYPGLWNSFAFVRGTIFPKSGKIARMGPATRMGYSGIPDGFVTDKNFEMSYRISFLNTAQFEAGYRYTFQKLTENFNPIDGDRYTEFQEGDVYDWGGFAIQFRSDQRKVFNYFVQTVFGGFYNGNLFNVGGTLNYRYQPFGSVAVQYDFNAVRLAEGYGEENLFLIGPRIDLTFTDKIFLTTFVQYNNLADNINLNARFQWRYKPASDFFVVYTENYLPQHLKTKNRALVFKLTYWLNI